MVAIDLEESVTANSVINVRAIRRFIIRNAKHGVLVFGWKMLFYKCFHIVARDLAAGDSVGSVETFDVGDFLFVGSGKSDE
jgi:hypothetical protein